MMMSGVGEARDHVPVRQHLRDVVVVVQHSFGDSVVAEVKAHSKDGYAETLSQGGSEVADCVWSVARDPVGDRADVRLALNVDLDAETWWLIVEVVTGVGCGR